MSSDFQKFLGKQLPLCTESPFSDRLNQLTYTKRYELINRSWDEYSADLVSGGCPNAHLCRGGSVCFGRPLPNFKELVDIVKTIPNVTKKQYLGRDAYHVYPTFCTNITAFDGEKRCPFVENCTTQCASMSSRLDLEVSVDSVGDESTLEYNDELDYSEMRFEHASKPVEKRADICWYGISDKSRRIVELYDFWAYDFAEIARELGGDKRATARSYHAALKKLRRNAKITQSIKNLKKFTYYELSKLVNEDFKTVKSTISWFWDNSLEFREKLLGLSGGLGRPDAPNPFTLDLDGEADTEHPTGNAE